MHTLLQDLRYSAQMLRQKPGFTLIATITLALGIGANTAIFSVVNAVLLSPLPFDRPETLVRVTGDLHKRNVVDTGLSAPELFDYRDAPDLFENISGLYPINVNLTGGDRPERVETLLVDVNYFDILGVKAQLGRTFLAEDYHPGNAELCVISDALWRQRFSMILLVAFALVALFLSAVGIYGVTSWMTSLRTREIGIRRALGAGRGDILRLILARGMKLSLIGVGLGLTGAMGLTSLMASLLFGVNATDPMTFAGVSCLLAFVALAACYIPARRATKVDPMTALRQD